MTRAFESLGPGYVITAEASERHADGLRLAVAGGLPRDQVQWLVTALANWLAATEPTPTVEQIRIVTGCAAVHPDRRGGQHVAMACTGVLVIDELNGLGVLVDSERSQIKQKERAMRLLHIIRGIK